MTDPSERVHQLISALRQQGWRIAVGESCTGGELGACITDLPGVSDVFLGGIIAYHNSAKTQLLGVSATTIARHGAVSAETAREMACESRRRFGADLGVAITGIAGPGGGTPEKPVGVVFIAVSTPSGTTARAFRFKGDRTAVRRQAVEAALEMALCATEEGPSLRAARPA